MTKKFYFLLIAASVTVCLVCSSASAGDMKAEVTADVKLFHSHFGQTPYPNRAIAIAPEGVHLFLTSATEKPEYTALYSFFKLGGDFEVSATFDWKPVLIPQAGYGVSCGIRIETNDKKHSVSLARGNIPGKGGAFLVAAGTRKADRSIEYNNEPPVETYAKTGRLVLMREKKEVICLVAEDSGEPRELCRVPFTDAAIQRVLIYADPGKAPTDLDVWITDLKIRAEEISHHMTKKETQGDWWGVVAGAALIVVGTAGFLGVRRIRTGRWRGKK